MMAEQYRSSAAIAFPRYWVSSSPTFLCCIGIIMVALSQRKTRAVQILLGSLLLILTFFYEPLGRSQDDPAIAPGDYGYLSIKRTYPG
jgi:hypothetical protein